MKLQPIGAALIFMIFAPSTEVLAQKVPAETPVLVQSGKTLFESNCTACHGKNGAGDGPAAKAISGAKPRDFTTGYFKFGSKPLEIFKTITKGSPGTAMPGWNSLPEKDRWALVYFLKTLGKK